MTLPPPDLRLPSDRFLHLKKKKKIHHIISNFLKNLNLKNGLNENDIRKRTNRYIKVKKMDDNTVDWEGRIA